VGCTYVSQFAESGRAESPLGIRRSQKEAKVLLLNIKDRFRELNNPLGVHPINWSNDDFHDLGGDTPLETCFRQMHEAGYAGTEIGHKYPRAVDELAPLMKQYELRLIGGWHSTYLATAGFDEEKERFNEHLNFLKQMNASVVIVAECSNAIHSDESAPLKFGSAVDGLSEEQWEKVYRGLDKLSELGAREGLPVVYHHHMGTVVQSWSSLDDLMGNTHNLNLLFDTGHLKFAGIDPEEILQKHADRIAHVHLKNVRRVREEGLSFGQAVRAGVYTVPGDESKDEPAVDYPPLLAGLADQGWYVVEAEQDPAKAAPLVYALKARQYLREITGL
jgi:inosose dehydratase